MLVSLCWVSLRWLSSHHVLRPPINAAIVFFFFFFCNKKMIVSLSPFREAAGSADISANFRVGGAWRSINLQNNALIRRIKWRLICLLANGGGTGVEHSTAHRDLKGLNPVGMENVICFWLHKKCLFICCHNFAPCTSAIYIVQFGQK